MKKLSKEDANWYLYFAINSSHQKKPFSFWKENLAIALLSLYRFDLALELMSFLVKDYPISIKQQATQELHIASSKNGEF